jgi:Mg-chelatase subunit ChlD
MTIKETQSTLSKKLMALEENGPTALGPALLTSISLATQGSPGSTVILCTDGLANIGLGRFDEIVNE